MSEPPLNGKIILVTGAAKRVGRILAIACARAGADVIVHYGHSENQALEVKREISSLGRHSWTIQADLSEAAQTETLIRKADKIGSLFGLVNSAAVFEDLSWENTSLSNWEQHLSVNLTAPFLLSRGFASQIPEGSEGRIINVLDWRVLRPGMDHFPYTISKAALAAMTKSLALALSPRITVNGLALGAILPPRDQPMGVDVLKDVPIKRWGEAQEIENALIFLLAGSPYTTGEIIHVDGGRHLV